MAINDILPGLDVAANIHPMLVHSPLGLWPVALAFFVFGVARQSERLLEVGRWLMYLATLAALVTAVSGWMAADGLGHDSPGHDLVHIHRNWMLAATGLSVVTCMLLFALRNSRSALRLWLAALVMALTVAIAALGADRGAYLVFGKGVGIAAPSVESQGSTTPHDAKGGHSDEH